MTDGPTYIAPQLWPLAIPIDSVNLDAANARKHPEKNMAAIVASLSRFGQRAPIVVQKQGMIVRAGNGRVEAAKSLGWKSIAAVVVDESSVDATAFAIADNRTAELAEWDNDVLASLLNTMPEDDLAATGFDKDDLAELLSELTPEVVEDEAPEPLPDPVSKTGEVWVLGEQRLMCGDSTKAEDVARVLNGGKPFIMVTDPPYGVEYDPSWRNESLAPAERRTGTVNNDSQVDWTDAYKLFPGVVAYVWHADRFAADLVVNLRDAKFGIRTQIIWKKPSFAISRGHYHWQHEPCWYAVRDGSSSKWCGDHSQSTVWDISNRVDKNDNTNHGTQKPIECMARPIRNHGGKDDDVYEPFSGSGTTLIACEQLGRKCYAIEIEPRYVDVAIRRWEKLTGKQATLESTGQTWAEVAAERGVVIA